MKKRKVLSLTLCAAVLCTTISGVPHTSGTGTNGMYAVALSDVASTLAGDAGENGSLAVSDEAAQPATGKEETVYVVAGADGAVQKLIVSDWLRNAQHQQQLQDYSALSGIENVKGDESFAETADGIVWDAAGNDIYYQGAIEKELPVSMQIIYQLDGTDITPEELAGKSGTVTIHFAYENHQYETVPINGKKERIYVPFAMLTGVLLDDSVFQNITVSNGKLVNDGDRTAVIGLAFPGLGANFGLSPDQLDIPDSVTITAEVQNFHMAGTVTVATNGLFNKIDETVFEQADTLSGKVGALSEGMRQLMDGSSALYDGIQTLLDKSGALVSGIQQLAEGAQALKSGSTTVKEGATALQAGSTALSGGLQTITANNDRLTGGAQAVFDALLQTASDALTTAGMTDCPTLTATNYQTVLDGVIAGLSEDAIRAKATAIAKQTVTEQVTAKRDAVVAGVTAAVREQVCAQVTAAVTASVQETVLSAMGLTPDAYANGIAAGVISAEQQAAVANAVAEQLQTASIQAMITAQTDTQMESDGVIATIQQQTDAKVNQLIAEQMQSDAVTTQIAKAVSDAAAGVVRIQALRTQLDGFDTFYQGIVAYTAGVSEAAQGASQLQTGANALADGSSQLDEGVTALLNGILLLKDGTPALESGVTALRDGSMQLRDGLSAFNEQAIAKLVHAVDGDVADLLERMRATLSVSKRYTTFSGQTEGTAGTVKFIYRTDSISEPVTAQ